jgi:hypothetical protein
VSIVLGDADAWVMPNDLLEGYRFERMQLWCISLSLWRGCMPHGGIDELINQNKYEMAAFILKKISLKDWFPLYYVMNRLK